MKIILIPLGHDKKEKLLDEILPEVLPECRIYWESINRYESKGKSKLGLEDSKLLALFEIILFVIAHQDFRLYKDIYEGTGTKDNFKFAGVNISRLASNAAKGSQAVINLKEFYKSQPEIRDNLRDFLKIFDIQELIEHRNDNEYLHRYNSRLLELYDKLMMNLRLNSEYDFINYQYISNTLLNISDSTSFFTSRFNATDLKEYSRTIRDLSNCHYLQNNSSSGIQLCCIGGAHIEDLRKCLVNSGIQVNIVPLLDYFDEKSSKLAIYYKISSVLERYFN